MEQLFSCVIGVEKHFIKKNSRDIARNKATGRMFPIKSNELKKAEIELCAMFKQCAVKQKITKPIEQAIQISFLFYFPIKDFLTQKHTLNQTLGDLSNLIQFPEDCLQESGIIKNDSFVLSYDGTRKIAWDKDQHALAIVIKAFPLETVLPTKELVIDAKNVKKAK